MHPSPNRLTRSLLALVLLAALLAARHHAQPALAAGSTNTFFLLTDDNRIAALTDALPDQPTTPIAIIGLTVNEKLVDIDVRPQNGLLYGLGVNATTDTGTLYLINPQNGTATPIGAAGQIALVDGVGNPIDFPDPATVGYGV